MFLQVHLTDKKCSPMLLSSRNEGRHLVLYTEDLFNSADQKEKTEVLNAMFATIMGQYLHCIINSFMDE